MTHNVALLSRDPGATNQMIAVDWLLRHLGSIASCRDAEAFLFPPERLPVELIPLSYSYGLDLWLQNGISAFDIENTNLTPEQILQQKDIEVVISGMDDEDAILSRQYWSAARKLHIPVIFLTDNDANIALRSKDERGGRFWPDKFLLSHGGAQELMTAGCSADRIHDIPDLHQLRLREGAANYSSLRTKWGVAEGETVVLFASECFREMSGFRNFPIDEIEMLDRLISFLDQGKLPDGSPVAMPRLVIRPHPRDNENKFVDYADYGGFPVVVSQEGTPKDAILSADVVVGMSSALLVEARLLNKPVLSLVQ